MDFIKQFLKTNYLFSLLQNKKLLYSLVSLAGIYIIRKIFNGPKTPLNPNVSGKVIIVTGATEGLGEAVALELLRNGATVIFACRDKEKFEKIMEHKIPEIQIKSQKLGTNKNKILDSEKNQNLTKNAIFIRLDLSDFSSVKKFAEIFSSKFQHLDILINNAAILNKNLRLSKSDSIEETLQVNTFSPMLLTQYLRVHLQASNGKVINVTGKVFKNYKYTKEFFAAVKPETYDFGGEKSYSAFGQYAFSKLGNFYFTKYLESKWSVRAAVVHPGVINTKISRDLDGFLWNVAYLFTLPLFWLFAKSKFMGAQLILHLCYAEEEEFKSGKYYENNKVSPVNKDVDDADKMNGYIEFARRVINYYGKEKGIRFDD